MDAYQVNILPLNDSKVLDYRKPLPPIDQIIVYDRSSVKRTSHVSEKNDMYLTCRAVTCKNCLERGHNIRSCKNPKKELPPKEKKRVGRPRKVDRIEEPRIGSRGGRSGKGAKGGKSGKVEEQKLKHLVEKELPTEETFEVPMSKNTVVEARGGYDDKTQAMIANLRECGYTEAQICAIINEYEEKIDETQPLIEYDDQSMEDDEEWINGTQVPVAIRRRRPSERITKNKLRKKIDGPGCSLGTPLDID